MQKSNQYVINLLIDKYVGKKLTLLKTKVIYSILAKTYQTIDYSLDATDTLYAEFKHDLAMCGNYQIILPGTFDCGQASPCILVAVNKFGVIESIHCQ